MSRWKLKAFVLSTLVVVLLCSTSTSTANGQQVGTNCSSPRIRKPWEIYTSAEKDLYKRALRLAMNKSTGLHMKFVEMHVEYFSELEAHRNCMFIYWHRLLLLGYENMLRSLGDEFKCITLPYWDELAATARQTAKTCSSLSGCASIFNDIGGTSGAKKSVTIYNVTIATPTGGQCVGQAPLDAFCGNNSVCAACMPRGNVAGTYYPAESYFASVYQQIFSSSDYATFTNQIERGVHNMMHSAISGVMAYFQSPADPIFFTHHGLIDVIQTIYLKCQNGADNVFLSAQAKGSDPRFWNSCLRRNSGTFTPADNITMRVRNYAGAWVNLWDDPKNTLYPFFKDLPRKFSDMVDAKDLGNYSYTYHMSGGLANMYQNCNASNTIDSATVNATGLLSEDWDTITTTGLMSDDGPARRQNGDYPRPVLRPGSDCDEKMRRWSVALYEAARIVGYEEWAANEQMEMISCQYHEDCGGGVVDYSDLFRENFNIDGHPRCFQVVQDLKAGTRAIGIPGWKKITNRFLPCDKYKKADYLPMMAEALE